MECIKLIGPVSITNRPCRKGSVYILVYMFILVCLGTASCGLTRRVASQAEKILLKDSAISTGFIGISIYEPATGKYWYNYNATKYFIPASNTKLFTLYAGMKYLGDSLLSATIMEDAGFIYLFPNADPSFLNTEFGYQPLLQLLKQTDKKIIINDSAWKENALGYGWAWDDYNDDYMAERSPLPIFGNVLTASSTASIINIRPRFFASRFIWDSGRKQQDFMNAVRRERNQNIFHVKSGPDKNSHFTIPFITNEGGTVYRVLEDELGKQITTDRNYWPSETKPVRHRIFSQPTDSLFKPMMHRSDNFFAEQTLLMVSNQHLGYMKDEPIIDTLLKYDLKESPQKPQWVDGSGLSRYNLFTPQSFIYVLNKMRNEFGWERLKIILPTGGEGTLRSYYKKDSSFIYAKTGTLSNNCALSGFLMTKRGKSLIFSILANHYVTAATPVRKAVERFLEMIRENH